MINPDSVNNLATTILPPRQDAGGQAEQKRAAWLLQMERALLAANQVRVAPDPAQASGAESTAATTRPVRHLAPADKSRSNAQDGTPDAALAGSAAAAAQMAAPLRPATPSAPDAQSAEAGSVAAATRVSETAAASGQAAQPMAVAPKSAVQASPGADYAALSVAASGAPASSLMPTMPQMNGLAPLAGLTPLPMAGGVLPLQHAYQSLSAEQARQDIASPALAVTSARAAAPGMLWGLSQPPGLLRPGAMAGQEAETAPALVPEPPETEPFAERKLHLYQGADGVQAWIRDADLNQMRAQLVAQALNSELNAAGLKLKTLTVNGRKLDAAGSYADDSESLPLLQDPPASRTTAVADGKA